ncbi:leucyl/phenylalanyl-tRNA--protein transferase [Hyphomicrobium sulfonivorans]|uniref:leucyl/phenylalanyl-tRNA--protein transferase n=1 Tax=Hyphomicrobium sulfonivorans TaxID=121290 RepID=UPI00156D73EB|nr:leucyl/phenylalanyl-tRNA--protein transferase [Hyphomicrobium sulfonivorans]MBI1651140.1 leucyl/phenylalanyl-tRNA--protein transferase [Hyphomicrobium sulfonivorans]NSL72476.1 leucyl/phenylalanyl-tRNA--protein transferase [Hyphomicrobium sulfonivorans]
MANVAAPFMEIVAQDGDDITASRRELFRETMRQRLTRWVLGVAYACQPKRAGDVPLLLWHATADMARGGTREPGEATLHARPEGFAGVARDVSPARVLAAARKGYFPWSHCGPLKWWTRDSRMVVDPAQYRLSKDARRIMRKGTYRVTFDEAFDEVIKACAAPRKGRAAGLTWITPKIMQLYAALHDQGIAHSFEVWDAEGELVGGGYGIAVGRIFYTESQFSRASNTSKIGFGYLNHHLAKWGFVLNDGKDFTPTLKDMGFALIPRAEFEAVLAQNARAETSAPVGKWHVEDDPGAAK